MGTKKIKLLLVASFCILLCAPFVSRADFFTIRNKTDNNINYTYSYPKSILHAKTYKNIYGAVPSASGSHDGFLYQKDKDPILLHGQLSLHSNNTTYLNTAAQANDLFLCCYKRKGYSATNKITICGIEPNFYYNKCYQGKF